MKLYAHTFGGSFNSGYTRTDTFLFIFIWKLYWADIDHSLRLTL